MACVLTESEVKQVLSMADGIRQVEEAFRWHAEGKTSLAPRLVMPLSGEAGNFRIMAAVLPEAGGFGLKTLTGMPGKRASDQTYFTILFFDLESGALSCVMPALHITGIRTGAASAVATKHLAREDATTLGLIGAGFQGQAQVAAIREVRAIKKVTIFDVVPEAARALKLKLEEEGVSASVAESVEETVRGSDIVSSATTSTEPVIRGKWLEDGVHVNSVGANAPKKREVDAEAFRNATLVLDFKEQVLQEAGDLMNALRSGELAEGSIDAELGDIVIGKKPGRESPLDITLFKSVGVATEDIAVAAWVFRQARERGLGTEMNLSA